MSGAGKSTVIGELAARGYKHGIVKRLAARTNNPYGKHPDEVARVLGLLETAPPLLRRAAGHEIDTSVCLDDVVATVLRLVQSQK
jgi:hypothetical protein